MMQVYFLSVLLNIIVGLLLVSKKKQSELNSGNEAGNKKIAVINSKSKKVETEANDSDSDNEIVAAKKVQGQLFASSSFNVLMGVLSILVGVIKLFVVSKSKIYILGDLLPSLAGIIGGFTLLVAYFVEKSSADNLNETFKRIFVTNASLIGMGCIVVAVLHFIIPGALFL